MARIRRVKKVVEKGFRGITPSRVSLCLLNSDRSGSMVT